MKRLILLVAICLSLLLFAGGLFLKKGVLVEHLELGSVVLSNVALKWQDKLSLQIDSLVISPLKAEGDKQSFDLSIVSKVFPMVRWGSRIFSKISIPQIRAGDLKGDLLFENSLCYFNLSSPLLDLQTIITLDAKHVRVAVKELRSERYNSHATGELQFNIAEQSGTGQFTVNLANSLDVSLELNMDSKQLTFKGKEDARITTITPFVDLFGLEQNIQRWITEYLTGSRYELKTFSGDFPWDNPLHLLESFYAEVRVDGCEYTFAPGLNAIQSEYTDVVFQKGVLVITPHKGTFYGQDVGDSWLDINFNDFDNILLTAYIIPIAQANQDIVNLVEYYDIPFPFKQTKGKTDVDLTLTVNFNNELVTAEGSFEIAEGTLESDGVLYDVKDVRLRLKDTMVTVERLQASFEEMLVVDVKGSLDPSRWTGVLDIVLQEASFPIGKSLLVLDASAQKPELHYTLHPDGSTITGSASSWKLDVLPISFGAFSTSFSLADLSGTLSPAMVSLPPEVSGEIGGEFSLKKQAVDLQVEVHRYEAYGLELNQEKMLLTVQYNDALVVRNDSESKWFLNNIPILLSPAEFSFSDNIYSMASGSIRYGDVFQSSVSGYYNYLTERGEVVLEGLDIKEKSFGPLLKAGEAVTVELDGRNGSLLLTAPELALEIRSDEEDSWSLVFKDLSAIYQYSPILQHYLLDTGKLTVVSKNNGKLYRFTGDIQYRYALLAKDGQPVDHYIFYGQMNDEGISATINKDIHVSYKKDLSISAENIFFNIPGVVDLLQDDTKAEDTDSEVQKEFSFHVDAVHSGFVLTVGRVVLADHVSLNASAGMLTVHLEHGDGTLTGNIEGEKFSLVGKNLNDIFMDALIPGSEFSRGTMELAAKGTVNDFSMVVKLKDTVMKEFNALNNILAMVNTIPALMTFSLPSYSLKGLPVDSFVVGLSVKDGMGTFNSLELESPEITMVGLGWIDFTEKLIGMDLNLITRAKKNINKMPLVGYILVGKEKRPSITVKISGDLDNPDVKHSIFREVATSPFSMLYRTLALPAHLVSPLFGSEEDADKEDKEDKKDKGDMGDDAKQPSQRVDATLGYGD